MRSHGWVDGWVGAMKPSTNILLLKSSCGNKGKEGRRERARAHTGADDVDDDDDDAVEEKQKKCKIMQCSDRV